MKDLIRKNIQLLHPYSCARDEFTGEASVYLDANESPYNAPYNRYPDPLQWKLKEKIGAIKQVPTERIFLGNGSDEAIDLIYRAFCEPREDNVVAIEPTYGMYKVCADINDVEYRKVLLNADFQIDTDQLLAATDAHTKVIWVCSPNNPTGNSIHPDAIEALLRRFRGIVVVDEAYIDFATEAGFSQKTAQFPRLIVLQTLSKAWGSAAIRLGMAFAAPEIIAVFNKIKYPYNVNLLTQEKALEILEDERVVTERIEKIRTERSRLIAQLERLPFVQHIYPTNANFVLVKVSDANDIYQHLVTQGIIVRNRSTVSLCQNCLRITVGTPTENETLMQEMTKWQNEKERLL